VGVDRFAGHRDGEAVYRFPSGQTGAGAFDV
jgi:hypothetical protein